MTPALEIIIVSHNTREDLVACLASIHEAPPAGLAGIFVVDNASADGSAEMVRSRWPTVELIALAHNVGFAAANNLALRRARAPLVLLLNSDTVVPRGAIDRLAARLLDTNSAAAGPRLVDGDGGAEMSWGPMISPWGEIVQRRRVRLAARRDARARQALARLLAIERTVDWVSGACLLVRRDEALAAGLLDERYFMYEEDVDFCAALRRRGGTILFTPAAEIIHRRGRSVAAAGPGRSAHYDRSHLAFYEKHHPAWAPLLRLWQRIRGRDAGPSGRRPARPGG